MENKIIIAIIGLLLILSVFLGSKACSTESPKFQYKVEKDETDLLLENALKKKEKQYAHNIWILEKRNDSLFSILQSTKEQLIKSHQTVNSKQSQVQYLSMRIDQSKDTSDKLIYCEALADQTGNLIIEQRRKDSLYYEALSDQDSIIKNQDTALSICKNYNVQLSQMLDTKLDEKKQLQQEITTLKKENARKTLVQKIVTAAALVLTGLAAATLLH